MNSIRLRALEGLPELPIGEIVSMGTKNGLSDAVKAAYVAPFPDESFKSGARRFPALVPVTPEHASVAENKAAWGVLETYSKPFLTAFSDSDPVTKGGERLFQERVPGTKGQPHLIVKNAGHFLQEDAPDELVSIIHDFISGT